MAASECWVERTHPTPRRVNLRPWLLNFVQTLVSRDVRSGARGRNVRSAGALRLTSAAYLEMKLCLTPAGTARPEEVLTVLGLSDLLEAGAVLERVRLELVDETPPQLAEGFA